MVRKNNRDSLRDLNWSAVYGDMPQDFEPAVRIALHRISLREKRRKTVLRIGACAAVIAVMLCIGAMQLSRRSVAPDQTNTVLAAPTIVASDTFVFSTKDDPYLHLDASCPMMIENEVEIRLITAIEFEKTPCPECCINAQFEY